MEIIAQIIVLLMGLSLFVLPRPCKVAFLLVTSILFTEISLPFVPLFKSSQWFMVFCVLLSEFKYIKKHLKELKGTVVKRVIAISLFAFVLHYIFSPHYFGNIAQFFRLFLNEELFKYFVLAYAFCCISDEKSIKPVLRYTRYAIYILTAFAVINYITKEAFMINLLYESKNNLNDITELAGSKFTDSDRFRVQALFFNPFDYGYICLVMFFLHLYGYVKKLEGKTSAYIVFACCLFGIATCGSRTVVVCWILAICVFSWFAFSLTGRIRNMVLMCVIAAFAYLNVPFIQEKVDETLTAFTYKSEKLGGSSVEMREIQYAAVMYHVQNHLLFGRGKDFFIIDLGWADGKAGLKDSRLWGLEGIHLSSLLEYGIVGYALYLAIFLTLLLFMYRNRNNGKEDSAMGVAVLIAYLSFAHMTGELRSAFPTLVLVGMAIKLLSIKRIALK